jgi:DNA topoisomerase-1
MEAALIELVKVDIKAGDYLFKASGSTVKFPGFMIIYQEFENEDKEKEKEVDKQLPPLKEGQLLKLLSLKPNQHFTQPPPRYTEASLVKAMENKGIGRPSTYSPIIETVQGRGYVVKEEKTLKPTELGFIVVDLMKNYFPEIIDVDFTAQLEDELDKVETGEISWQMVLNNFYAPFLKRLEVAEKEMEKVRITDEETDEVCPHCGKNLVKKFGRYGEFYACPGFPDCRYTMQPKVFTGVKCPLCGGDVVERRSKRGRKFFGCSNYPNCKFVSSQKPVDKSCPQCNNYLVERKTRGPYLSYCCSNKECTYVERDAVKSKGN